MEDREILREKAIVAMSGGVDSSVAALLLQKNGYDCMGVTLKLFDNVDIGVPRESTCCSTEDVEDARSVAGRLGIPHYVFNFTSRFRCEVIDRFISAYEHGRTPNPCIDCNRYIKFDALYRRAAELDIPYVATGHYARVAYDENSGRWQLLRAVDPSKDQSYVLYSLTQDQLAHTLFPLGGLTKTETRRLAEENGFLNAKKHDSQDICFVPDGDYASFIESYTGKTYPDGSFIDADGHVLGRHRGVIRYTVGQRRGLGLSFPEPMYVTSVGVADNTVTLGRESELYSNVVTAHDINLISVPELASPTRLTAKIRYRQTERPATVTQTDDDTLVAVFDEPQRAVTKGQALVLYDGDVVVGGGTIE